MRDARHTRTAVIAADDFPAYRRRVLRAGLVIVQSSPVGAGYVVTTRARGGAR